MEENNQPAHKSHAATWLLVLICIAAYPFGITQGNLLAFSYNNLVYKNEWWTVITATFIHGNLQHLLGNMLFLFLFGRALEEKVGPVRLLFCFFVSGALCNLSSVLFFSADQPLVGASGAISTILGLLMIYSPWRMSFLLNFFPMPMGVAALTYVLLNIVMTYRSGQGGPTHGMQTAYQIHIIGFLIGIVFSMFWNKDWKENLFISILSFIVFYVILAFIIGYFNMH